MMDDNSWVVVWVRNTPDHSNGVENFSSAEEAALMARTMSRCYGVAEVVAVCPASRLRQLQCRKPPAGWWCSREPGHDGPCAARPC